ncbi:MAG: rhodanese-like domain-containing protein [Myxococcota bacterium]|nr:rhodanese-like domain-containing protein [Myxococcota bacterium]
MSVIKSIARLPFKLAKVLARKIQEEDRAFYEKQAAARSEEVVQITKDRIPAHELADLPASEVTLTPNAAAGLDPFWLDVRDPGAWGRERIAGAEHMRAVDLMIRLAELPSDTPLVCYSDDGELGLTAVLFLRRRGFHQAWNLKGGIKAWKSAGHPTES